MPGLRSHLLKTCTLDAIEVYLEKKISFKYALPLLSPSSALPQRIGHFSSV